MSRKNQVPWAPSPEHAALLPEISGCDFNGWGEAEGRRPRQIFWLRKPGNHPFAPLLDAVKQRFTQVQAYNDVYAKADRGPHKLPDPAPDRRMSLSNSPFGILYDILPNGNPDILGFSISPLDPLQEVSGFRDIKKEIELHGHCEIPHHTSLFLAPCIEKHTIVMNSPHENSWSECTCRICSPVLTRFAGFPLKIGTGIIGMIGIANSEHEYSDEDILDFEAFAHTCSLAISAARGESIRKSTQEKLMQSQKMEAIGQLAGGIAHDFNNLLTVINGYSTLALQKTGKGNTASKDIEQVINAGERATALIRQLLAFGKRQVFDPQPLKINTLISGLHKILSRLIGENISLNTHLTPDVWMLKADPSQIEQIIINLVINARDAMERGGIICIETCNRILDSTFARDNRGASEGEYVMLSVRDTGMGMSEEIIARIFEPFFTTKEEYGTGLGLATVYGIVNQSKGYIQVLSEVGIGSEFRVYIPKISGTPDTVQLSEFPAVSFERAGTEKLILLVEDEAAVLNLAAITLRSLGYTVCTASNPREALRIFDQYADDIDLLLTDVIMPDMSGPEMALMMREKRPDLKLLFMSGYSDEKLNASNFKEENLRFMMKPFSSLDLAKFVSNGLNNT